MVKNVSMEPDAFIFREKIHKWRILNDYKVYRTAVIPNLGYAYPQGCTKKIE